LSTAHSRHFVPYLFGLLAHVHSNLGHDAGAMEAVTEGIALIDVGGERFYMAELHPERGAVGSFIRPVQSSSRKILPCHHRLCKRARGRCLGVASKGEPYALG
jgi:hypothetical protein